MNPYQQQAYDLNPETNALEAEQFEWSGESGWGAETEWGGETGVFSEAEAMELASELLEVTNEEELDLFLGDLIKKAGSALGKVVKSPIGQAVGGLLKAAAKKALPLAGTALGGVFGGPLGAQIGSGLASAAGGALGLEAEAGGGMSAAIEGAKKFVQASGGAVKTALQAAPATSPAAAAQAAVTGAIKKHLPELLANGHARPGRSGRWVRQGRNIIIMDWAPARA